MEPIHITNEQRHDLASAHKLELADGRILRVVLDYDDSITINDFDCYGKIAPVDRQRGWTGYGHANRPDGFDGAAEILLGYLWWQPPVFDKADRRQWHTDAEYRSTMRETVCDLIQYGFQMVKIEVCQGTDAYGRAIVIDYTVTGGHEQNMSDNDLADVLDDMIALMNVTAEMVAA